ncbi:dehydrodolichyl diphosphate synthase 2-like isoform X2 [Pistacia vera]|uniref:dehydrodolichyl diphosphate synthase 2-like isoform X2 n=1 Tax=Pistacia vera TaxID=55513 RepID=UPI001262D036|nr:dehydrodolichyl diphosphate synthase 2-like isoform X2 [Pistacia vera]XP_031253833.1 dehydrodolichyl diphosphate synthase 2-like isoform X2 [Pistacia vera]
MVKTLTMVFSLRFSSLSLPPHSTITLYTVPHVPNHRLRSTSNLSPPSSTLLIKHSLCPCAAPKQQQHLLVPEEEEEEELKCINEAPSLENDSLPPGIRRECMPRHVAVIMDGNRRWARLRDLPVGSGYEAGVKSLKTLIELCCKWGIRVLTVFAFSTDNWFRPNVEVEFLMSLFEGGVKDEMGSSLRENIRISVIGDISKLPKSLEELIINVEESTKNNSQFQLIVAVSYSGRYDLVQACQRIAMKVKDGIIELNDVNESLIEQELETNCTDFPYPDLLIRTSEALQSFQQRWRRYGE